MNQIKRDFGSFHSSNVEELIRLDDDSYVSPEHKVEFNLKQFNSIEFGSDAIKAELFYLQNDFYFLNHGAFGLTFKPILDLVHRWQVYAESQPLRFYDREVLPLLVDVIRKLARVIDCKPTELVLVENCTFAFNSVLNSLKFNSNEKIFIFNLTYGVYKKILKKFCLENGVELVEEEVKFPILSKLDLEKEILEKLKRKLCANQDIKYVFVDYIPSNHPFVMPVKEIIDLCHSIRPDIMCIIDAAHALGSVADFSLINLNADILFGNCHKWLCGPKGTAFLYKRESIDIKSIVTSHGFASGFHSDFLWSGLKDYCAFLALSGTLDIWLNLFGGFKRPIEYCRDLATVAAEHLKVKWTTEYLVHPDFCSTMLCVKLPKQFIAECLLASKLTELTYDDAEIVQNYFYFKHNIEVPVKAIQGELYVRISCHVYNKMSDYEYLGKVVSESRS